MPLSAFTHFEEKPTPLVISHQGQFPAVTISFNLAPGKSIGDAVNCGEQGEGRAEYAAERECGVPGLGAGV